ncbi:hypothetical protein ACIA8K_12215 [Catenuloplanes sp. NPDC051500]|uniref:hypothetical protein n=1 Tax=Catenuloplanes sp. NPDC051500 TaxID=3363959 RepID=UPI003796792B
MKLSPRVVFLAIVVCGLPSAIHVGWRLGGHSSPLGPAGVGLFGEAPAGSPPPGAVASLGTAPPGAAPQTGVAAGSGVATPASGAPARIVPPVGTPLPVPPSASGASWSPSGPTVPTGAGTVVPPTPTPAWTPTMPAQSGTGEPEATFSPELPGWPQWPGWPPTEQMPSPESTTAESAWEEIPEDFPEEPAEERPHWREEPSER